MVLAMRRILCLALTLLWQGQALDRLASSSCVGVHWGSRRPGVGGGAREARLQDGALLALRGGASSSSSSSKKKKTSKGKVKKLDPTGTPLGVKLLRPVSGLCNRYDRALALSYGRRSSDHHTSQQ